MVGAYVRREANNMKIIDIIKVVLAKNMVAWHVDIITALLTDESLKIQEEQIGHCSS